MAEPAAESHERGPAEAPTSRAALVLRKAARAGVLGAAVGGVITLLGQLVLQLGPAAGALPRPGQRLAAVAVTISLFGAITFVSASIALAASRGRATRGGGPLVALVVAAVATLAVLFHLLAMALRLLTGSGMTRNGLAFFLNGAEHIAGALTRQYLGYLAAVLALTSSVAWALYRLVRWGLRHDQRSVRRSEIGGCVVMTGLSAFAVAVPLPAPLGRGVAQASPELAMLASAVVPPGAHPSPLVAQALESPRLPSLDAWTSLAQGAGRRPNVVVVLLESVAASHVGHLGYERNATPHLDRIAEKSLVMTRAYTTATHSNYAQMAVISSLFPRRGTALDMYHRLDYPRFLLHDLTSPLDYAAATVSSQDEGWQGMRRFQETPTPVHFHHAPTHEGRHLDLVTEDIAADHETVRHAIDWVAAREGKPFSLYVNLQSTHFPYPIPPEATRRFVPDEPKGTFSYVRWEESDREAIVNRYDNALGYVDQQVGALYDALATRGLLDDTIFVVTSDHGELFFEHDLVTHGRTLFEGESRVPLLVHYPAGLDAGVDGTPVSTLDVLPTVLELMELPPHPALQGESFAHLRSLGPESRRTGVFLNIQGWKHLEGVVCPPYKLVLDPDSGDAALYDLERDPREARDVAAERPEVRDALRTLLESQITAQDAYHANDEEGRALRADRFAPRMLSCPTVRR